MTIFSHINNVKKLLSTLLMLLMVSTLTTGCGFKLRGSGYETVSGKTVFLQSKNPYGPLLLIFVRRCRVARSIKEKFSAYDLTVKTTYQVAPESGKEVDSIPVTTEQDGITVISIASKQSPISVDANGQPAEYQTMINAKVSFLIKSKQYLKHFSVRRDYRYDKNNALAHTRELEILTTEMFDDLGQRITTQFLRQLSSH